VNTNTLLVVDDRRASRKLLVAYLKKAGYTDILEAESGEQALEICKKSRPNMILLDIVMPGMNGYEVCEALKKDPELSSIPVIFLSALDDTDAKVKAFEKGGVDYLTKPFELQEIKARVGVHLKLFNMTKELERHSRELEKLVENKVRELYSAQIATIYAIACLAEARDYETGMHLHRTQALGKVLVEAVRDYTVYSNLIDDGFITAFCETIPLHDIGKVAIPDAILRKPGKLTPEEYEIIKTHTTIGAETLEQVRKMYPENRFISTSIDIAHFHHEKWDGSGYPKGLKGAEIPLTARIAALIDVYDALRSQRPYKRAFRHEEARLIILEERGRHFDPVIVDAFIKAENEFACLEGY